MNIDYSAYEGFKVRGYTETVLSRGKVVVDQGALRGAAGRRPLRQARSLRRGVRAARCFDPDLYLLLRRPRLDRQGRTLTCEGRRGVW